MKEWLEKNKYAVIGGAAALFLVQVSDFYHDLPQGGWQMMILHIFRPCTFLPRIFLKL